MIKEIDRLIHDRISIPIVREVYEEWKNRNLLDETLVFLNSLPANQAEPIRHSFITHVHKEKGLFVDIIGRNVGVEDHIRTPLAASADILWAISLMVDMLS